MKILFMNFFDRNIKKINIYYIFIIVYLYF